MVLMHAPQTSPRSAAKTQFCHSNASQGYSHDSVNAMSTTFTAPYQGAYGHQREHSEMEELRMLHDLLEQGTNTAPATPPAILPLNRLLGVELTPPEDVGNLWIDSNAFLRVIGEMQSMDTPTDDAASPMDVREEIPEPTIDCTCNIQFEDPEVHGIASLLGAEEREAHASHDGERTDTSARDVAKCVDRPIPSQRTDTVGNRENSPEGKSHESTAAPDGRISATTSLKARNTAVAGASPVAAQVCQQVSRSQGVFEHTGKEIVEHVVTEQTSGAQATGVQPSTKAVVNKIDPNGPAEPKMVPCPLDGCGILLREGKATGVRPHLTAHHSAWWTAYPSDRAEQCPLCTKQVKKDSFRYHFALFHIQGEDAFPFSCCYCGTKLRTRYGAHLKSCTSRPYVPQEKESAPGEGAARKAAERRGKRKTDEENELAVGRWPSYKRIRWA
ncbi:hypothetical protein PHLGIDRAFT_16715 [Phlebiopsis gigantea 11061_1 CR5-6]|uniref:Uncharacterized protein n=1 Tax=Phlebiopsis gigantea (strain 11061_1 CR5-6) TaxID=745531 RepID=A0A0C3S011_PHLG1|nr:hypothetical protein PHLGIDRAFT_16715 [Phlebiopsis gigantea 11061_1 CR5-6]